MIITTTSYPRAALIGNPSDGYNGKTLSFTFANYAVTVELWQSPELEILSASRDHSVFASLDALVEDVAMYGYYGGIRLIKATLKKFREYCDANHISLDRRNYTIRYTSTIPIRLGLAGSSAIISATTRSLMKFYGVEIPRPALAAFLLSVETEELGISAGLQDRVAMAYGGLVYMDFSKEHFDRQGYGNYEPLEPGLLENIYIAYRTNLAEGSEVLHNNMRGRYDAGEPEIHAAVERWAELTVMFRRVIEEATGPGATDSADRGRVLHERLSPIINENYDLRRKHLLVSDANHRMVMAARELGASAKFTGSGGAIIGTYRDQSMLEKMRRALAQQQMEVVIPEICGADGSDGCR